MPRRGAGEVYQPQSSRRGETRGKFDKGEEEEIQDCVIPWGQRRKMFLMGSLPG